jgi:3',5'-cyclic AMP phosphodiesterase CpdA
MPEANLRVAFLGDQGLGLAAWDVLQLLAREKPALVVHAGDLSYGQADPLGWEANINEVLGRDFPYVVAIGNHDLDDWEGPEGFATLLRARLKRTPGLRCDGELGVKTLCRFRGLELVLSGVGTTGTDHEWYLERTLVRPGALVRLCVWHMNQHDFQVGSKIDEVGWGAYQICARHGAPIITAHEHSYARTFALTAIGDRGRGHGATGLPDSLQLGPDRSFVVVTGLGGHSSRSRTLDHAMDSWWASIYANNYQMMNGTMTGTEPSIQFGALFIDFHVDGDPRKARAYFKTTKDQVVDRFELHFDATRR